MSPYWIAAAVCAACTVGLLWGERRHDQRIKWLFKPLASAAFIAAAFLLDAHQHPFGLTVIVGLCLSALGDVLLIPRSTGISFLAGLGAFLLGHVAYSTAFAIRGVDWTWVGIAAAPLLVFGVVVHRWLKPDVPKMLRVPVVAYIVVICTMALLAVGTYGAHGDARVPVAATLFVASDISVGVDRFKGGGFGNRLWGVPLYFGAQLVFAAAAGL